ncbi:Unknown protein sequence [Pseudomonas syringae pv. maculicola]|nr:Unknown protein sequence [Pseudomonas syringae pv. maculicola]
MKILQDRWKLRKHSTSPPLSRNSKRVIQQGPRERPEKAIGDGKTA